MLNKTNRLTKRKEYGYIYKKGVVTYSNFLILYTIPTSRDHMRMGFSISKKVGKAHERNLLKRRLSEIVRANLHSIDAKHNYILVCKEGIASLSFEQLSSQVMYVFNKANMWITNE